MVGAEGMYLLVKKDMLVCRDYKYLGSEGLQNSAMPFMWCPLADPGSLLPHVTRKVKEAVLMPQGDKKTMVSDTATVDVLPEYGSEAGSL